MAEQKSKRTKRPRQGGKHALKQWSRTADNVRKRRKAHSIAHPNDAFANKNWEASPANPNMARLQSAIK